MTALRVLQAIRSTPQRHRQTAARQAAALERHQQPRQCGARARSASRSASGVPAITIPIESPSRRGRRHTVPHDAAVGAVTAPRTATDGWRTAWRILDSSSALDVPPARAGIAFGDLLLQAGDCFGLAVNLASRIVDRAPSGAVVVDEQVAKSVQSEPDLALEALPDSPLKGIGTVPLWRATARNRP